MESPSFTYVCFRHDQSNGIRICRFPSDHLEAWLEFEAINESQFKDFCYLFVGSHTAHFLSRWLTTPDHCVHIQDLSY